MSAHPAPSGEAEKRVSDSSTLRSSKAHDEALVTEAGAGKDVDGVWGQLNDDGPNYRNLGWIRAGVLCTKCQIGLGVLAIPEVCSTFGLVPTILLIVAIAVSSAWCQIIIGMFKRAHPSVYSVADVGMIMYGRWGREVFGIIYWINLTAIAGAGLIGFSTALNALSTHGTCTVVFVLVAAILNFLVSAIQTLDKISFIGWIGLFGLMSAIITLTISVGVQDRPAAAPQTGPFDLEVITVAHPSFLQAMPALSTIVFAYAGAPNYFGILAEMRRPQDFKKTVVVTQTFTTMTYLVVGCVTYHFCGQYIASPALGSAGHTMKKVCYGLALPGLLVGAVLNTHIPAKYVFLRLLGKTRHLTENTKTHYIVWYGCVLFNTAISFIIAESIPGFDNIISLIGSALAINLTYTLQCLMWFALWRSWPDRSSMLNRALLVLHVALFFISLFISVGGSYANGVAIRDTLAQDGVSVFDCADNSGSV